jgi:DNA polymerase III subunit gamma/tau
VGKTTLARVFAKALNCEGPGVEPCGECAKCREGFGVSTYYTEYDCGQVGSAKQVREIGQKLMLDSTMARYRVVVFDEFHMASKTAQSALLKVLEELNRNTFVVMCTTELDKMLDTIRSRSEEQRFKRVAKGELTAYLARLAESREIDAKDEDLRVIAEYSHGHVRDAVKTLDLSSRIGFDAALSTFVETRQAVEDVLRLVRDGSSEEFDAAVERMIGFPRALYVRELRREVYDMLRSGGGEWGSDSLKLFKLLSQPWADRALKDDLTAGSLMWVIRKAFSKKRRTRGAASRFRAGGRG